MSKREKLNWMIAIVGLIASVISILAFVTGASSLPGIIHKQEPKPPTITNPSVTPASKTEEKKTSKGLGDVLTAGPKNGLNWLGGRLKVRHSTSKPSDAPGGVQTPSTGK